MFGTAISAPPCHSLGYRGVPCSANGLESETRAKLLLFCVSLHVHLFCSRLRAKYFNILFGLHSSTGRRGTHPPSPPTGSER